MRQADLDDVRRAGLTSPGPYLVRIAVPSDLGAGAATDPGLCGRFENAFLTCADVGRGAVSAGAVARTHPNTASGNEEFITAPVLANGNVTYNLIQ